MEVLQAVQASNDEKLITKVTRAVEIIARTIDLYGAPRVAFSFNGGKDCTILLHLIRAAVAQKIEQGHLEYGLQPDKGLGGAVTFFFHSDSDFPEINQFTFDTNDRYKLEMTVLTGDFKRGLETLVESGIQAIILGTRSGDPNAPGQEKFCPSSAGWPPFMRVNPVLDWSYHDVWSFLQTASLPYCELYDRGYTSLGSVKNTLPNSALLREDGTYAPAYLLPDARLERAGRLSSSTGDNIISRQSSAVLPDTKTAALVIIGDEILSAKVEDVNTAFLCSELRAIGWKVCKVVIVTDDTTDIAKEVARLSGKHDVVLTSGGLGPTVDDVTMAGVAEAFGCQLARHPELETRIRAFFGNNVTESHLKMSEAPTGSEVAIIEYRINNGELSPFPLVRCRNVYVLPGIPHLLQKKWLAVKEVLLSHGGQLPFHTIMLRLRLTDETRIAAALEEAATNFSGQVAFGSYPVSGQEDGCGVVLCLESKSDELLEEARRRLVELLPEDVLVHKEHKDQDKALNSPAEGATLGAADGNA